MRSKPAACLSALFFFSFLISNIPCLAAVSIYTSPEELTARAALVVEATVVRTASGMDPNRTALATYTTLEVSAVHRGPSDLERVVIREPGGRFGHLVNEIDAVPTYTPGERVLVYLEPAADGTLRTSGMFFGKFRVESGDSQSASRAVRDLDGRGRILAGPAVASEAFSVDELSSLCASIAPRPARSERQRGWTRIPREFDRVIWDDGRAGTAAIDFAQAQSAPLDPTPGSQFVPMSLAEPARWVEPDSGIPVAIHIQRANNPLGDGDAAVAELERAMAAWSAVPQARVTLTPGNTDFDYTGTAEGSPASVFTGTNIVLFGDPYDEISNGDCSGVLAIGGYWRSASPAPRVNNVDFHPILQLYTIFNDNFECFLGNADNLAEIATHELGHGLGFGHSAAPDSIMRATAYGQRGARLGMDDIDAAHCHYPHTLTLNSPLSGAQVERGSTMEIQWSGSAEWGADPGLVTIEVSTDGGEIWSSIAADQSHDGFYRWETPDEETTFEFRLVRRVEGDWAPDAFPDVCSASNSSGPVEVTHTTHGRRTRRASEHAGRSSRRVAKLSGNRAPRVRGTASDGALAP